MSTSRSFKEYVSNRFYENLFASISDYIDENFSSIDLRSDCVDNIDAASLSDIEVKTVGVDDRDDMRIGFDVILEAEIEVSETTRRYDNSDTCFQWFLVSCEGDLENNLDDFAVINIQTYNQKNKQTNPLSDSLIPYLYKKDVEAAATDFLKRNYPEALGTPMPLDVAELAKRMGLTIEQHHITQDYSVFGQIFFADCNTEVYDADSDSMVTKHIKGGTILVDPEFYHLRNLGSVNNTIVHECVHWDRHRKAFELERLYNKDATQIKCLVIGGVKDTSTRSANDWMEWQANTLAPRIQMPLGSFKVKASEFIKQFRKELSTFELVDVMEPVIDALASFFCVSRHAAKIRMIDAGYEEAIGAFTYIDGRYVCPHAFKKGALEKNQTFSICADDAVVISYTDIRLRAQSEKGAYIYVDSHFCLNESKYITRDANSIAVMTEYGRLHVDECCLAFTLKVKSKNKYAEEFYKECVLFRDINSGLEFITEFSKDINDNVMARADAVLSRNAEIKNAIKDMPDGFGEALVYLMKWSDITVERLAEKALLEPKMLQRMRNDSSYPKSIESVVAVCIGMQLPPELSQELINRSGFQFRGAQNNAHILYKFFITNYYTHPIAECNEMLVAKGYAELSGKE